MKITKYILFTFIVLTGMSCASLQGNHYYNRHTDYPLTMVFLDDSTSMMYYANSLPVTKIHYDVKYGSTPLTCTVKQVEIIDSCIYDYLNKNYLNIILPKEDKTRYQLVCEGDKIIVFRNAYIISDKHYNGLLLFLRKSEIMKIFKYSKGICRGVIIHNNIAEETPIDISKWTCQKPNDTLHITSFSVFRYRPNGIMNLNDCIVEEGKKYQAYKGCSYSEGHLSEVISFGTEGHYSVPLSEIERDHKDIPLKREISIINSKVHDLMKSYQIHKNKEDSLFCFDNDSLVLYVIKTR